MYSFCLMFYDSTLRKMLETDVRKYVRVNIELILYGKVITYLYIDVVIPKYIFSRFSLWLTHIFTKKKKTCTSRYLYFKTVLNVCFGRVSSRWFPMHCRRITIYFISRKSTACYKLRYPRELRGNNDTIIWGFDLPRWFFIYRTYR